MPMCEEHGVEFKDKHAAYTIRMCILTDRMATMMVAGFAFDEIEKKFLQDNYLQSQIIRTYNHLIDAGKNRGKIEIN